MSEQAQTVQQTAATAREAQAAAETATAETQAAGGGATSFAAHGAIPPVAHATSATAPASASDQAFGAHAAAQAPAIQWHGGEPLPVLKELFFAPTTDGNLVTFMKMIDEAPVRPGTHIRTPLSPQDGLATITTDFVIRVCNKYLPYAKKHAEPKRHAWLEKTLHDHLTLLATPAHGSYAGGHLTKGLDGKLDALVGPSRPYQVITVNQTAITLLTLEDMKENPDPQFQATYGKKVEHLIEIVTPEFHRELLRWYPPDRPAHDWHYGSSGRLEDQAHVKTTYDELVKLGKSKSRHAAWYAAQARRIAHAYPRVTGSYDGLSNQAGSI